MQISLLSTIDRNYRAPLEVLACSLLLMKRPSTSFEWHIMTDEIDGDWDAWRDSMNARHCEQHTTFVLHRLRGLDGARLPLRGRARPITYARLLAPDQLSSLAARLLYLDADMIVLRAIEELWCSDLGNHPCGGCQDLAIPTVSSGMGIADHGNLGLDPDSPYFNAGVLLIDTQSWKRQELGRKALDYLATHFEAVNLFDQEALNVAVGKDWQQFSYRWNLIASVAGRSFLDTKLLRQDDYRDSLLDPCIVHYAGTLKPWLNPFLKGRWFELYRSALVRALPTHKFHASLRCWAHAGYDARLRHWAYPLERTLWQATRGF